MMSLNTTRFQLILPVDSHNVTKNLTGQRMHVEGPQIYQMNHQTNSFKNMCDMLQAEVDRLAGNILSKETLKNTQNHGQPFGYADFGGCWRPNR